jgi:hypothetical protein
MFAVKARGVPSKVLYSDRPMALLLYIRLGWKSKITFYHHQMNNKVVTSIVNIKLAIRKLVYILSSSKEINVFTTSQLTL